MTYLRQTQRGDISHVRDISLLVASDALLLDPVTLRHLNVVEGVDGGRAGSLLDTIDRTMTPMGGRLLRAWLVRPLAALARIQDRLDAVEDFAFRTTERAKLRDVLKPLHDLERLVARVSLGTAGPRDLVALRQSLALIPRVIDAVSELRSPLVRSLAAEIDDLPDIRESLDRALVDEPPAVAREGGVIRDGFDADLDGLRTVSRGGKAAIAAMEDAERTRTGIASLKIRYNRVFGYYIEISKSNLAHVPSDYHRKQTVADGERYVTPQLKDHEDKVLHADERIVARELDLFDDLVKRVAGAAPRIIDAARAIASLDVLAALAEIAAVANYTKPHVHDGDALEATDVRHPVVERSVSRAFVPNDIQLAPPDRQLVILTGPNMGGKSTYLRQTAILAILAQAGSFVPARSAKVALVDRIFARVGASDNIARGQSTFMVEMQETAAILGTPRPRGVWSSSTRSAAVRPRSTDSVWPGPWLNIWRRTTGPGRRRSSRLTITSSPISPTRCPASSIVTSRRESFETTSCSSIRSSLAGRTAVMASRSPDWLACPRRSSVGPPRSSNRSKRTSWTWRGARACASGVPAAPSGQLGLFQPATAAPPSRRSTAVCLEPRPPGRPSRPSNLLADPEARGRLGEKSPGRPGALGFGLAAGRAPAARAPNEPRTGLVVAMQNSPATMDPGVALDEASQKIQQLVFRSLLRIDDHLRVVPDLATRFEALDPLTYLAEIPAGVRFHDGREMTAKDVAYTFRRVPGPGVRVRPKVQGVSRSGERGGPKVRYTVRVPSLPPGGVVSRSIS